MSRRRLVRFRAGGGDYAVALEHVVRVEAVEELQPLPDALPEVAGLLRAPEGTLPVLESLGAGGGRVLVLESGGGRFGLVVDEVMDVAHADGDEIAPAPPGQRGGLVTGLVPGAGDSLLIDPEALASRLQPS